MQVIVTTINKWKKLRKKNDTKEERIKGGKGEEEK